MAGLKLSGLLIESLSQVVELSEGVQSQVVEGSEVLLILLLLSPLKPQVLDLSPLQPGLSQAFHLLRKGLLLKGLLRVGLRLLLLVVLRRILQTKFLGLFQGLINLG